MFSAQDKQAKEAARASRVVAAVPANEASRLDERIEKKNRMNLGGGSPQDLQQFENELLASTSELKAKAGLKKPPPGSDVKISSTPGALAMAGDRLSHLEERIASKTGETPHAYASGQPDTKMPAVAKMESRSNLSSVAVGAQELDQMEANVVAKSGVATGASSSSPRNNDKKMTSGLAGAEPVSFKTPEKAVSKRFANSDVEYGLHDPTKEDLMVATPVTDDEEDSYIQSAVEFDPDAKPALLVRRSRFRLYGLLIFCALLAAAVGAVVGVVVSGKGDGPDGPSLPYRETLGIQERVERLVGADKVVDPESPYHKALMWITHNDTMELDPDSINFVQRYVCAYFYFATTEQKPWKSCNPSETSDECIYSKLINVSPVTYQNISWTRWLSSKHECSWSGLVCDDTQEIRTISLVGQDLTGPFPEGIKHLPLLQYIELSWSELYGPLPPDMLQFKHLVSIELQYNRLSGSIPEEWFEGRLLARLNLANNNLNGTIPKAVGNAEALRGLYLQFNSLEGTIPSEIGRLSSLSYVLANKNLLSGSIPPEITNMDILDTFNVHSNQLEGSIPDDIGKLSLLREFRLKGNSKVSGSIPDSFYSLKNLARADLRDCNLTGQVSPRIGEMESLLQFRVNGNPLSGPVPSTIQNLANIRDIQLQDTDLTGSIPSEMCARRGDSGIYTLSADCKAGGNSSNAFDTTPQIECECCSLCCDPDGLDCSVPST